MEQIIFEIFTRSFMSASNTQDSLYEKKSHPDVVNYYQGDNMWELFLSLSATSKCVLYVSQD